MTSPSQPKKQEQTVPHSVESEEALLGAVLIDPDILPELLDLLTTDDFFIVRNAWVWEAMQALHERETKIDYLTVVEELRSKGKLEELGGPAYITYLINHTPPALYAEVYAQIVKRAAYRRDVIKAGSDIVTQAFNAPDLHVLEDQVNEIAMGLQDSLPQKQAYLAGKDALAFYAEVMKQRTAEDAVDTLTLPWEVFTQIAPGIKAGKLILVGGFSGEGKTMILEGIADWWAMLGHKVFFISTELTREDMLDRMVCRHTGIPYDELVAKSADSQRIIREFARKVKSWLPNLDIWETNGANAKAIYRQIQRAYEKGHRRFFIDYLSEAVGFDTTSSRDLKDAIDNFFRWLHNFGKKTGSTFVIATQQTQKDHGPVAYGSSVPNQKAALHIRLDTEKAADSRIYTVDNRLVPVREGDYSPIMKIVTEKNNFGPKKDLYLFKDGARFRYLDESEVSWTPAYTDTELEEAAEKYEQPSPIYLDGFEND